MEVFLCAIYRFSFIHSNLLCVLVHNTLIQFAKPSLTDSVVAHCIEAAVNTSKRVVSNWPARVALTAHHS